MVKTVTTRTVRQVPLGPDGLPIADGSSPLGSYTDSIDRRFMKNGERFVTPQATSTLTRSYNHSNYGDSYYSPHDAYGDVCDNYGSLSRGLNYRPYRPYGYRMENSYTLPIRRDDYGHMAQPQVPVGGSSTVDLNRSQPERFQPEPYGLEDDRRSLVPDDEEPYELEPDYSTANRRTLPSAARAIRDPLRPGPHVRWALGSDLCWSKQYMDVTFVWSQGSLHLTLRLFHQRTIWSPHYLRDVQFSLSLISVSPHGSPGLIWV